MTTEQGVELEIPADPAFTALLRVAAANVAAQNGFDYDQVEDMRMAVGEAVRILLGPDFDAPDPKELDPPSNGQANVGRLRATFTSVGTGTTAVVTLLGGDREPVLSELSEQILDSITDWHSVEIAGLLGPVVSAHFTRETDGDT